MQSIDNRAQNESHNARAHLPERRSASILINQFENWRRRFCRSQVDQYLFIPPASHISALNYPIQSFVDRTFLDQNSG